MYVCMCAGYVCMCVGWRSFSGGRRKEKTQKTTKHRAAVKPPPQHPHESALTRSSPLFASSLLLRPQSIFPRLLLDVYTNRREMALSVPDYLETVLLRQLLTLVVSPTGSTGCRKAIGAAPLTPTTLGSRSFGKNR